MMRTNGGAAWISPAKSTMVKSRLVAACDALDGASDGVISNTDGCHFDFNSLLCPGGTDTGDTCLSASQLAALNLWHTPMQLPYSLANGINTASKFDDTGDLTAGPFGTTAAFNVPAGGGSPPSTQLGSNHWFADGLLRYAVMQDANADTLSFDPLAPGSLLPRLQQVSSLIDQTNPNIQTFLQNSKWLVVHGRDDQLVPAQPTIDYYKTIVQRYGQSTVDASVRLYQIPGYAHATGSFNANFGIPLLEALENWVEKGQAPGNLEVSDSNTGTNRRSRPLCVYPTWPKYNGTGDVNVSSSFTCVSG